MTIVGYTYWADIYCPLCISAELLKRYEINDECIVNCVDSEHELDTIGMLIGIDRYDEYSFDSDNFPKVIFSWQVEDNEFCCICHEEI